ncbi:hypothetical protein ABZ890_17070 [Streptomyces sp. NPDC046984]|uniref:hypothetical protein n=1 Tax=Streptomyces sp. NPDC046984 TaxID=3155138 RepID=UPI0033CE241A
MRESRAALADAGTVVPSLRLDPVGPARGIPRPPVEPGGRRVDFAALRARRAAEA